MGFIIVFGIILTPVNVAIVKYIDNPLLGFLCFTIETIVIMIAISIQLAEGIEYEEVNKFFAVVGCFIFYLIAFGIISFGPLVVFPSYAEKFNYLFSSITLKMKGLNFLLSLISYQVPIWIKIVRKF